MGAVYFGTSVSTEKRRGGGFRETVITGRHTATLMGG